MSIEKTFTTERDFLEDNDKTTLVVGRKIYIVNHPYLFVYRC